MIDKDSFKKTKNGLILNDNGICKALWNMYSVRLRNKIDLSEEDVKLLDNLRSDPLFVAQYFIPQEIEEYIGFEGKVSHLQAYNNKLQTMKKMRFFYDDKFSTFSKNGLQYITPAIDVVVMDHGSLNSFLAHAFLKKKQAAGEYPNLEVILDYPIETKLLKGWFRYLWPEPAEGTSKATRSEKSDFMGELKEKLFGKSWMNIGSFEYNGKTYFHDFEIEAGPPFGGGA